MTGRFGIVGEIVGLQRQVHLKLHQEILPKHEGAPFRHDRNGKNKFEKRT